MLSYFNWISFYLYSYAIAWGIALDMDRCCKRTLRDTAHAIIPLSDVCFLQTYGCNKATMGALSAQLFRYSFHIFAVHITIGYNNTSPAES